MIVAHAAQNWLSLEAANQEEPGAGNKWIVKVSLINDLSQAYEVTTVSSLTSGAIVFPAGKIINLLDRKTSFIFALGGTANGFDVLDAGNGNTATLTDKTRADHFGANGDGVFDNGPLITYLKSSGFKVHFTTGLIYRTTTSFQLSNETEFHGNWSTLFCEHNLVLGDIDGSCYIGEFIIDGETYTGLQRFKLTLCTYRCTELVTFR